TKGLLPVELGDLSMENEVGITLISLSEEYRKQYEPFSAPYTDRIESLFTLHRKGLKTWVSIEPYPTPNIIDQNFDEILEAVWFVDKIIFGKLNYNPLVSKYSDRVSFYNELSNKVISFCSEHRKEYHIKQGTRTDLSYGV
ncbi:MAG: radical SAM protein, partial [Candidatus Saccharibacteria bacterium]